jgi:acetylornithine deacetylase/succinyl-diaminopimelate desuccinylase-like protein
VDTRVLRSEVVALDRDLVRLDTSNPPGNEGQVANFMRDRLAPLGFEVDVVQTPTPGKAHLIARLGSAHPTGKPVLLSAHEDTVGVERELWSVDPFAGVISGGYLYGRGSFDDKGGIAVFATAAMRLARAHVPLKRDIVLVFEADEEGGDYGIEWLADNHWDKLDAAYSLNEGGIISTDASGRPRLAAPTVRDKISLSVKLRTRGVSTHSSRPQPPSAIDRLARAMTRISRHRSKPALSRLTRRYFRALARASRGRQAADLRRLARASTRTDLYAAVAREVKRQYPGTVVTPALYEAATDAGPWRERGIPVYGLRPYLASSNDLVRMHGIDERVSIRTLDQGTDMVERILRSVAAG